MSSSIPRCPVILDGSNYLEWVPHMRVHMRGLRLWDIVTGALPCPLQPIAPVELMIPADASEEDKKKLQEDYEEELASFDAQSRAITAWADEDARACSILTASVIQRISNEIVAFPTSHHMWLALQQKYESSSQAVFLEAIQREQALCQGDSSVEDFFDQLSIVWHQIDSLRPQLSPATCTACQSQATHRELRRLYDFLVRLRPEFEPV